MNEQLVQRVKISLAKQFYCMNDSWLEDCIEYFFQDNQNPSQEEIITFVKNQWHLSDLRDINNENGSLPKNLTSTKCTTLPGKYILQMEKIYDISVSKFKQLEKIRQVSSENIDATENENTNKEDKFQAWEPKSKRMLHLCLTDGIQNIAAIEYKPIRFLKDSLFPGYKLLIKGPVICRRGVILLEEMNIAEIGGEVDSLLIVNAVENIFARALNLKENPDPYGDVNKNVENKTNSQAVNLMDDDFELDSQSIAQIEKQIQNSNSSKNSSSVTKNTVSSNGCNSTNLGQSNNTKIQKGSMDFADDDDSFLEMVDEKAFQNIPTPKTSVQQKFNVSNQPSSFARKQNQEDFPIEDELNDFEDSPFFESSKSLNQTSKKSNLVCSSAASSKVSTGNQSAYKEVQSKHKNTIPDTFKRSPTKHQTYNNSFTRSPSSSSNSKNTTRTSPKKNITGNSLFKFPSSPPKVKNVLQSSDLKQKSSSTTSPKKRDSYSNISNKSSPSKPKAIVKPSSSHMDDVDFNINDFESSDFSDSFGKNYQYNASSSKSGSKSLPKPSIRSNDTFSSKKISSHEMNKAQSKDSSVSEIFETQFGGEFNEEFESKMEVEYTASKSPQKSRVFQNVSSKTSEKTSVSLENKMSIDSCSEQTGVKRLASIRSPNTDVPHKKSCTHSTLIKDNSSMSTEMKEFINEAMEINEESTIIMDLLYDVKKYSLTKEESRTVVRGIVTNIVKLNLLKKDQMPYFHLEGSITDYTEKLEVVFSSEVLEKIIGMSPLEFSQKRRLAKASPDIKAQLRGDLQKAENVLRNLDVMMELELKKNEKAVITSYIELTDLHKKLFDEKVKKYAKQKYKK